jgi:hypothetical protein
MAKTMAAPAKKVALRGEMTQGAGPMGFMLETIIGLT